MAAYLSFLQSPSTANLASDASISYITTTTAIKEPTAILKHLTAQAKQLEKKEEKILSTIEGERGCCVETLTTLLFKTGGGAFLPSMDSNLLDEREVTFPLTHVVTYDAQSKIQQIRLYWDQGTLLKQVEAIGRTGRNWPIRDGKAQADFVTASIKAGSNGAANNGKPSAPRNVHDNFVKEHTKRDSVSVTRDPHASLSLFAERDVNDDGRSYSGPKYGVAKSAKPAERDYGELFTNEDSAAAHALAARSKSPHKTDGTILKAGAGKHHTGNRLFDEGEDDMPKSPERKKHYEQKYEHFAFGDGEDAPTKENRPLSSKNKSQHNATFSFEDFATPPKHQEKPKPDFERHWGAGVDDDDPESPPKRPIVHAARKDADSHWEMSDVSPLPAASKVTKSFQRQKGMGLYQDPTMDDERTAFGPLKTGENPKTATTNTDNARRGGDFSAGFAMVDNSPAGSKAEPPKKHGQRTEFTSNWGFDGAVDSPPIKKIYKTAGDGMGSRKVQDESVNVPAAKKIYKTAGDGMGSRSGGRAWGIGDESDPEVEADIRPSARARRTQAQAGADLDF